MVSVAQLVERQTVALNVVGSTPTTHPSKKCVLLIAQLTGSRKILSIRPKMGILNVIRDVAQLVAHSLWERGVASSSLAVPTIFFSSPTTMSVE